MTATQATGTDHATDLQTNSGLLYWLRAIAEDENMPDHVVDTVNAAATRLTKMQQWARGDAAKIEKLQPFATAIQKAVNELNQ